MMDPMSHRTRHGAGERALGLGLVVWAMACGPELVGDGPPEDGSGSETGPMPTTGGTSVGTTATTTGANPTTSSPDSTAGSSSGDPEIDCGPLEPGLTYVWCGDVRTRSPVAADDLFLYFARADDGLWRVPMEGGDAEMLVDGIGDIRTLRHVHGRLYWNAFSEGELREFELPDGPMVVYGGLVSPSSFAVGEAIVVATQYGVNLPVVNVLDGSLTPLFSGPGTPFEFDYAGHAFFFHEGLLYFATNTDSGNNATPLYRGLTLGPEYSADPVLDVTGIQDSVLDGSALWWARYSPEGSGIVDTSLDPLGRSTEMFALERQPIALVLTEERVYWRETSLDEQAVRSGLRRGGDLQDHIVGSIGLGGLASTSSGVVFATYDALVRIDGS